MPHQFSFRYFNILLSLFSRRTFRRLRPAHHFHKPESVRQAAEFIAGLTRKKRSELRGNCGLSFAADERENVFSPEEITVPQNEQYLCRKKNHENHNNRGEQSCKYNRQLSHIDILPKKAAPFKRTRHGPIASFQPL
jgi:hypothetical protein